jgi:hypothetical protein
VNFTFFSGQFLVGAYLVAREAGGDIIRSGDVLDRYDLDADPMWIHTALDDWRHRGWVSGRGAVGDEKSQPIRFTGQGLMHAESLLDIPQYQPKPKPAQTSPSALLSTTNVPVPASDRIVTLDHNSPQVREVIEAADGLASQLEETNDTGNLSAEAVEVAIDEVQQIASELRRLAVRMPAFSERAKSTLSWIGKEAAGALVGAAALGLLALLAALLGFSL